MKRTSFRMIASSSQGQALYVCFNKWKTVKSTKGRLCELHDSMYVIPACYKLHEKLEYLCSTKTLSSEGVWENLQQQVLPSSSLYKTTCILKTLKRRTALSSEGGWENIHSWMANNCHLKFLLETTSILIYMYAWDVKSNTNCYNAEHSKNIKLH